MSFILDALKKSETDRQRQSGPSLFEVKVAAPRRRLPIWAVAIAVLLAINLIVVSWMLLRHPSPQQPAATSAAAAPGAAPVGHVPNPDSTVGGTGLSPAASSAASGPAASAAQRAPGAAASPPPPSAPTAPPPSAAGLPPASSGAPPASDQSASQTAAGGSPSDYAPAIEPGGARGPGGTEGAADVGLPLYQQIVDSAGLPSLHLDLHVFADRPQDRFVMINMHRLGEGDSLPGGVQVQTIRPDGVVLTYHGTRFLLPRN